MQFKYDISTLFYLEVVIMNVFQLRKFKNLYHVHSEHIESFNFKKTPQEIKSMISEEDFNIIQDFPILRVEEQRKILINEGCDTWEMFKDILVSLDTLPEIILRDVYSQYLPKYRSVNVKNFYVSGNEEELTRRLFFCLIPEILWAKGDEKIRSRMF